MWEKLQKRVTELIFDKETLLQKQNLERFSNTSEVDSMIEKKVIDFFIDIAIRLPQQNASTILGNKTLEELELFTNHVEDASSKSIFDRLNKTSTKGGGLFLRQLMSLPCADIVQLEKRKQMVENIGSKFSANKERVTTLLQNLNTYETDLIWLFGFDDIHGDIKGIFDIVYFKGWGFNKLNNIDGLLYASNLYKIIASPVVGLLSPIVYFVIPYLIAIWKFKLKLPFFDYIKFTVTLLLSSDFFGASKILKKCKVVYMLISALLYFQGIFNSVDIARTSYKVSEMISSHVYKFNEFIKSTNELLELFWDDEMIDQVIKIEAQDKQLTIPNLKTFSLINNFGSSLNYFKNSCFKQYTETITKAYVLDAFIAVNILKSDAMFGPVIFENRQHPYLNCNNVWHPYLDLTKVVKNPWCLGGEAMPNAILTGPNAGGKSTLLKSLLINVLLAQTITVANADTTTLTPFKYISCQINIPDCKGKESLFEAEMHRSKENLDVVGSLEQNQFALVVLDEVFSSTNPIEGVAGAYAIAKKLGSHQNVLATISTHFVYLTKLARDTKRFKNYKMNIFYENGKISYPYTVVSGTSKQYIALELLKAYGYDDDIIEEALNVKKAILQSGN